jgi:uncharacterized protein DUF4123
MNTSFPEEQSQNTFIVLDGALINAPLLAYRYDDDPWFDQLYRGTRHAGAIEVSPCLIRPSGNSRFWEHQTAWGSFGVGIKTRVSAEKLIDHLRSLISLRLPNGQQSYCRFYSNKHLALLLDVFSDHEARSFSGPIFSWFSTHPAAPFDEVQLDGCGECRNRDNEGWFQLSSKHLDALSHIRETEFSHKLCQHLGLQPDGKTIDAIKRLNLQAQQYGFNSEREVATFVELAWGQDEHIHSSACQRILNDGSETAYQKLTALDRQIAYGDA